MNKILILLGLLVLPFHTIFATDAETEKIQWHLNRVEGILRQVDTNSLSKEQSDNRKMMLDRLHSYTETGKFPNNDLFPGESIPFFRGSNGNLCAVGYLMDADPEYKTSIENIVKTNNNIKIMETQNNPVLNKWAKKYGFSILELAMIQPTYKENKIDYPLNVIKKVVFLPWFLGGFLVIAIYYPYIKNRERAKKFAKFFGTIFIVYIVLASSIWFFTTFIGVVNL